MPLSVVRSHLGLLWGGPGLLPWPPALATCRPEAYIIQYCGSICIRRTLLDTYTSQRSTGPGGAGAPPGSIKGKTSIAENAPKVFQQLGIRSSGCPSLFPVSPGSGGAGHPPGYQLGELPLTSKREDAPTGPLRIAPLTDCSRGRGGPISIPNSGDRGPGPVVWRASPSFTDSEAIAYGSWPLGAPPAPPKAEGVETPTGSH